MRRDFLFSFLSLFFEILQMVRLFCLYFEILGEKILSIFFSFSFLKYFKRWEDTILLVFFLKLLQMMTEDFVSKPLKLLYENYKTSMEARNVPRGSPHVWINSIRLISITKENGNKKRIVNQAKSGWNGIKVRPWIPKLLSENSRLKRLFSLGDTYRPMCSRHRLLCKTLGIELAEQ